MTDTTTGVIRVAAISGSLRRASFNTAALRAAAALTPDDMKIELLPIADLPMFDADLEAAGTPPAVAELRAAVAEADALLIATPEYNYSITGALKNAIDWLSRGPQSPLDDKPVAILGAGGRFGTLRAQLHLRDILMHNRMKVVDAPQVYLDRPAEKFDHDLQLTDERAGSQVARLLLALRDLVA